MRDRTPTLACHVRRGARALRPWIVLLALGSAAGSAVAQDAVECAAAVSPPPEPLPIGPREMAAALRAEEASAFTIVLEPGAGLERRPDALAAFRRAAARWEAVLSDPVTVTIEADFAPLASDVLGEASSRLFFMPYDQLASLLRTDAQNEPGDAIVASLPTATQFVPRLPGGLDFRGVVIVTKANLKALGMNLDSSQGPVDASITFNSNLRDDFDFDARDGIASRRFDFESLVAHEIGHVLGFSSLVDEIEDGVAVEGSGTFVQVLDLYRFEDTFGRDPDTPEQFRTFARNLLAGSPGLFDDAVHELQMSTGRTGDGREASHWKDDALTGVQLGIMDPTSRRGIPDSITAADLRALDLIGWETRTAEAAPSVSIDGPIRVASGQPVQLRARASDEDGLGFPVFEAFGRTGRLRQIWDLRGGTALEPLAVFALNPRVRFDLPPGARTTVFEPTLTAFDFLGDATTRSVQVTVSEPPAVSVSANGAAVPSIRVRPGESVAFSAAISDADGLGFPVLAGLGIDRPFAVVWNFGGGQPAHPLQAFVLDPRVRFEGTPGQTFTVSAMAFDAVGVSTTRSVRVELAR